MTAAKFNLFIAVIQVLVADRLNNNSENRVIIEIANDSGLSSVISRSYHRRWNIKS